MTKRNPVTRMKRSVIGIFLGLCLLGGVNTGCDATLTDAITSAGITVLEYAVESLLTTSTTDSTSS